MTDAPPTPKAAAKGLTKSLKGHKPIVYLGAAAFGIALFFYIRQRQAAAAVTATPTDTGTTTDAGVSTADYPIQYSAAGGSAGGGATADPGGFNGQPAPGSNPTPPAGYMWGYDDQGFPHLIPIPGQTGDTGSTTTQPGVGPTGGGPQTIDIEVHQPVPTQSNPTPAPTPAPPARPPLPSGWNASNSFFQTDGPHAGHWYHVIQRPSASHNNAMWDYRVYDNDTTPIPIGPVGHS